MEIKCCFRDGMEPKTKESTTLSLRTYFKWRFQLIHHTAPSWLSPNLTPTPDYYAVLGLSRDATVQEINRAWRRAVLLHHPDKRVSPDAKVAKDRNEERAGIVSDTVDIRLINEAKWVLGDSSRRRDWEESFQSTGDYTKIQVDTTPHVSYDISLAAFTPHYDTNDPLSVNDKEVDQGHGPTNDNDEGEPIYYTHPCRCSSEFVITYQDLVDGVDIVGCGGCGEWVRVGYEAVSEDEG